MSRRPPALTSDPENWGEDLSVFPIFPETQRGRAGDQLICVAAAMKLPGWMAVALLLAHSVSVSRAVALYCYPQTNVATRDLGFSSCVCACVCMHLMTDLTVCCVCSRMASPINSVFTERAWGSVVNLGGETWFSVDRIQRVVCAIAGVETSSAGFRYRSLSTSFIDQRVALWVAWWAL